MARISTYGQDSTLNKLDKVLGTDSATGSTKNYTIDSMIGLVNSEDLVNVFDGVSYSFKSYEVGSTNPRGIINLNAGAAANSPFSGISQIYISVLDKHGNSIANYLDDTVNSFIRIVQKTNIDTYGVLEVTAVANHDGGAYKLLTVTPRVNNGNITANEEYFVSNYSAVFDQDFSDDSVTEFSDVTSAGSGQIITSAERTSLNNFTANGLLHADVVDNVASTATNVPLSANQGKILKGLIDSINTLLTSNNVNLDSLQEVVDYIEANRSTLDSLGISNISGLQAALDAKQNTEIGKGLSANDFTDTLLTKLNGIAAQAEVNAQPNWNETNVASDAFIQNKPSDITNLTLHSATELNDVTSAGSGAIITSTERTKLNGIATGAEVNVKSNWNETDATADSFIQNKPTIPADTNTTYDLTVHDSGDNAIIRLAGSDSVNDDVTLVAGNNVTLTPSSSNVTVDIDLTTAAVTNGSTSLVTGDHVFDYADPKFARKDQAEIFTNNVTVQGNLTVSGTTTTVNSTNLNIGDAIITLNSDLGSGVAPSENAGIEINRGSASDVALRWNESNYKWEITEDGSAYSNISTVAQTSDLSDVNITSLANNQILKYNSSTSKWENQADAGGIQLTDLSVGAEATAAGNGDVSYNNSTGVFTYTPPVFIDGSGTTGNMPKFSDSDTLADSAISESGQVVDINVNGAIKMPDGTTAQRPSSAVAGMFRYNTTDNQFEGYTTEWGAIAGSGGGSGEIVKQTFSGTGSQSLFTLSNTIADIDNISVYVSGVYQYPSNYTVSGANVTFAAGSIPASGTNNVHVVHTTAVSSITEVGSVFVDQFTGNGNTQFSPLGAAPSSENHTDVYIDGVYQQKNAYSITGSQITFTSAPDAGAYIEVKTTGTIAPAAVNAVTTTLVSDSFTATAGQTSFTLTNGTPSAKELTMVFVQGVYQAKANYSLLTSPTRIVLTEGAEIGESVEVLSISGANLTTSPVTSVDGNTGAVTSAVTSVNGQTGAVTVASTIGVNVINSSTTATANNLYVFTANLTLTLPASPSAGDSIKISNRSGVATCVLARNGSNIMGSASDLTLDTASASFELIYSDATNGWVIIGQ